MANIVIQDFGGKLPRRSARLLPENYAQIAENTKLLFGDLRGFNGFTLVHEFPTATLPKKVWRVKNTAQTEEAWFSSQDPKAELIKSPIVNDAFDRYYLFEEGEPPQVITFDQIRDDDPSADLAFGQPTAAPTLAQTGGVSTNLFTRVYAYTFVTEWGEESVLSPVKSIKRREDATSVTVTVPATTATIEGRNFEHIRIYRTVTSASGAQFYFVADIPWLAGGGSFIDDLDDTEIVIGSTLTSSANDPPVDGLMGARVMGNGSIVAFKDRELYFSIPFLPHAWPSDWRLTVHDLIVGIAVQGQNVMVMTQGYPTLVYGNYPDAMAMMRYEFPEPCVGYGTIVPAPEGVYFQSYNGLNLFTPSGVQPVTNEMISRNIWQAEYLDPASRAERLGSQYICSKADTKGFVIDGQEHRIALTDLVGWLTVGDISADIFTSDIYAISFDAVYAWDTGPEVDYRWKSKKFVLTKPQALGALMLHIEPRETEWVPSSIFNPGYAYPEGIDKKTQVLVKVYGDGRLVFNRAVSDKEQCRLPSDTVATVWEIEIQGQCRVTRVALAEVGRALEQV